MVFNRVNNGPAGPEPEPAADRVTFAESYEGFTRTITGSLRNPEVLRAWLAFFPNPDNGDPT